MKATSASIALLLCGLACGERAPSNDADVAGRGAAGAARDSAALVDSTIAPPDALARACIAGDPEQGVRWTIDSVALTALAIEGVETLASRDSARLAARLARMVDVIPTDTSVADFGGLPVTVRTAWRVVPAEGDTVIVALVVRRVPIESAPLEELFTIIAAPGQRQGVRDPLVEGWFVREVGAEEELVARELAGAYLRGTALVFAFAEEATSGVRTALVERNDGAWRATWSGRLRSCATP